MPPTQYSIFGRLLCRRYKSRMIYIVLSCSVVHFTVLLLFYDLLTVIPPVKQPSIEVLRYIILCYYFLL